MRLSCRRTVLDILSVEALPCSLIVQDHWRRCLSIDHDTQRHFRRSYLKANKVSKSEGTRKIEHAYQLAELVCWCWLPNQN